ncbi:MAG: VOC family protein [Burkholderiales bacterium]|nr:VOC family protein [Burkholderiales bacterium]
MNLGAARVFVRDFAEAKAFYSQRLGLTVEAADEEHGFCMFDTGAAKLIIETVGNEDKEGQELVGRFTGLSFPVEDIQSTHRQLCAVGVEFSGAPEQQYWGGWLATFIDPSGNGLQLVQEPAQQTSACR